MTVIMETNQQLFPTPELPSDSDYQQISNEDFQILHTPEMRARYITLTDGLIQKMVEQQTEVAVFLDKSARPIAWMVRKLWDQLQPDVPGGEKMPMPEMKFLNIDREQWGAVIGRSEGNGIDIKKLPKERISELRRIFEPVQPNNGERTMLSDKTVMVIDEVRVSGDTLDMATQIMKRAFPDAAEIEGEHWMIPGIKIAAGVRMNEESPVWYDKEKNTGRGVANRDTSVSSKSSSRRQQIGKFWLGTAFKQVDRDGLALRNDINLMTEELRRGMLPYIPSSQWPAETELPFGETIDHRIERLDGMPVREFAAMRRVYETLGKLCAAFSDRMRS